MRQSRSVGRTDNMDRRDPVAIDIQVAEGRNPGKVQSTSTEGKPWGFRGETLEGER